MEAVIVNFKRGRHRQTTNQMILKIEGSDTKEKAAKFVGKKVTFSSPAGKKIEGEIRAPHGNKGALRALFEKGLPGQSIGKKVVVG